MREKRLVAVLVLILGLTFAMLPSVTGDTAKKSGPKKTLVKSGQAKKGGTTKKGGAAGAKLFEENCSTCHEGGNNSIEAEKTLKVAALKANGFNGVEDIKQRIREGKAIMPAFADQLKPAEIDAIANYVWGKAQKDWK